MPNTLAHFGVQGILGHRLLRGMDPKLILLGCVIPDVPWIFQRALHLLSLQVDLYDLRLYAISQATLLGCVILSGAISCLCIQPKKAFFILTINSCVHLLLDSSQLKWANGVHLFAPFTWELWNLGWYWPESIVTYGMTVIGLVYVGFAWRTAVEQPLISSAPSIGNSLVTGTCMAVYFLFPFLVMSGAEQADNHYIKTLREVDARIGREVEFDRVLYIKQDTGDVIQTLAHENLTVMTKMLSEPALVSVKGRFVTPQTVSVEDIHIHSSWFRDVASEVGIIILLTLCLVSIFRGRSQAG